MGGTIHRRDDTATSFRTLTSIDVHSPATPSQVPAQRQMLATSQQRISSTGRISPSNSSPPEFPPPRPLPRHPWQRSASCRELYASSFEDSGKARPRDDKITADLPLDPFQLASQGELDNPVTRYDESNRSYSAASSKLPSLDHDSVPERVYSSSYPGTSSLSTESGHEESGPAGDLSHDDLSHDSYELLEREREFEYPESYSSPHDEHEAISDQSDEGIEHEMFQMDSETDSFVKHRSQKSSEKQQYKSAFTDLKNTRTKSIDRYSAVSKTDGDYVITESRIQRSSTQIERKFETRHATSVEQPSKTVIPHQDSARKDPVVLQVQKQKVSVLNELKNLKPKYKITHVDSEVLRDEGIMRPKSRIDDDLSPVEGSNHRGRTTRARSIASLDDHPSRLYVETGSLGRGHKSRDRKPRDADIKIEKALSKERRSVEREDSRKRIEKDHSKNCRRVDKSDSRERRSMDRLDSRERKSESRRGITRADMRELRRSIERLDMRERGSYEHLDLREKSAFYYNDFYESRGKSVDRLDSQGLRSSTEYLRSPKEGNNYRHSDSRERREKSSERLESRESRKSRAASIDYGQRHTLERFDSGNRSPFERLTPKEQRRMSIERLDSQKFDFDPRTIERLKSLERYEQRESRAYERKHESRSAERKSLEKLDSRERRHLGRLESREGRSLECLDFDSAERRKNIERTEYKTDQKRSRSKSEKIKPADEKPRERDDWRSLEKARKDDERRERERQAKLSIESRTDTVIGVPHEMESLKPKAVFTEYEPKVVGGIVLGFEETALPGHMPVERTKSDPNPARQRLGSNNKRHMLMHQKSIDLTPADSGDEEPFSDSAAMQKTNVDIPYTLHKRHVMNGTASDEKSESDSSKTSKNVKTIAKDLPKLPLKMVTDIPYFDLTKLSIDKTSNKLSPDKPPKGGVIVATKPKSILSPSDKPKSILSPTSKLSPTDPKSIVCSLSPTNRSPLKTNTKAQSLDKITQNKSVNIDDYACKKSSSLDKKPSKLSPVEPNVTIISALEKRSPKKSPTDPNVTIISVIQKKKSLEGAPRSPTAKTADSSKHKAVINFADVVTMEMKQALERKKLEKETLKIPEDNLESQDSIEKIPLPEIPSSDDVEKLTNDKIRDVEQTKVVSKEFDRSLKHTADESSDDERKKDHIQSVVAQVHAPAVPEVKPEKPPIPEKPKTLEKPSIPEKTKRILERIESKFSEVSKISVTKISRPKIIDTGFDDFVDPVAELPLDEVPVKPALELDSLKVPEFVPFMLRPHAEPLRSKSLSLAEEKAPIDTLLSPEVENKHFVQDVSPKRMKKVKSEPKKDFKKQSKSLEGDKPPLKKAASKESRAPVASAKIDKSKLKLGEMPQEIIIIDSTDVAPEISIVQKGRSKSVTRLSDKPFSTSKEEKEETKTRAKSASVDDELIKGAVKSEKTRPKSLGISKSLGSTEKKDSVEKISPKRTIISKIAAKAADSKIENKSATVKDAISKQDSKSGRGKPVSKVESSGDEVAELKQQKESKQEKDSKTHFNSDVVSDQPTDAKQAVAVEKEPVKESIKEPSKEQPKDSAKKVALTQELTQSPLVLRKPGQTPILFARARLGLSEGSGIGALQRQGATQSPTAQRRAKSLDAAVISVHRLPPTNAFSSKDDTVDVSEVMEDQENMIDEAAQGAASKTQSLQMEASPNHKSDSTDHTTVPEILTDSLSVTETSAQYLESPLTECNEIVAAIDLIPYEQEAGRMPFMGYINGTETAKVVTESAKEEKPTKFIDQSSAESGEQEEASQESFDVKSGASRDVQSIFVKSISTEVVVSKDKQIESLSDVESYDKESNVKAASLSRSESIHTKAENSRMPFERDDVPDVTISAAREDENVYPQFLCYDQDEPPDMVKSPIQISIEECSDDEANPEDEEEDDMQIQEEEIDEREEEENKRLDSLDTSEDTLDALDTQVQMRGVDSEMSSPDYGVDKMDEKTLVEVELTPEYLEMKREDQEAAEELPEDEPVKETARTPEIQERAETEIDTNRLFIDKKLRLSTERSRSEETNTWTPDREDPDSSSCSIARPLGIGQIQPIMDRREIAMIEGARYSSLEDDNSNSSQPPPKNEMSTTWKSFPQENSGSSSLEEGWAPQDESNAQQSQSEDSNGQNEDSFQEDLSDFPGTFIYPIGPEILANYGSFSLSRTLSRISERSTTSEQDKSDLEDSFKPSSRSPSLDDESLISSDHQPSLSSDPPSGTALPSVSDDRRTSSELPDIPIDIVGATEDDSKSPRTNRRSRLQLQSSEDWPSPPSSPVFDTPVMSHVETFYMEIKPEEAVKVTVTDSTETPVQAEQESDSSDENRTLHDDLHSTLLEDGQSSTSATTVDGTVKIAVKPKSSSYITGSSHSEDTSMGLSMSEWSSSNNTVRQFCQYSGTKSDDNSLAELGASISDWSGSTTVIPQQYYAATVVDKSQSDTTTSEKSATSMRPNSKCQKSADSCSLPSPPSPSSLPLPASPPLPSPPVTVTSAFHQEENETTGSAVEQCESLQTGTDADSRAHGDEFDGARRFVESQFDEQEQHRYDDKQQSVYSEFVDVAPPRITLRDEYDEAIEDDDFQMIPEEETICVGDTTQSIPEEDEEDQLYDNVPAMKYSNSDKVRVEVGRGDSSEDMHEKYADLASQSRTADDEWSSEERRDIPERGRSKKTSGKFDRGFSEPSDMGRYQGTRSTERPVMVPIRAKSTPYYSTTSLSGESTTSSPPMPIRTQIRTKTMACSSSRSPQSEGDTSSSMDSPAHTPDRGQRAFRRKRQQNVKRRHRVVVDLEVKDGHIVSSTDSSFDVATIPPPLLTESQNVYMDEEDEDDDEMSETKDERERRRQQQH